MSLSKIDKMLRAIICGFFKIKMLQALVLVHFNHEETVKITLTITIESMCFRKMAIHVLSIYMYSLPYIIVLSY